MFAQLEFSRQEIQMIKSNSGGTKEQNMMHISSLIFKIIIKMENLQIPDIAETTIYDGSFATPVLEDITHGQRQNSRLFHTREENGLPFYYNPRHVTRNKISVACSNNYFAKCDAKFFLNSKNPTNIIKVERDNKRALFKFNYDSSLDLNNWEVEPNSGNFEHSHYCRNQVSPPKLITTKEKI